jgi:hypothetical protein
MGHRQTPQEAKSKEKAMLKKTLAILAGAFLVASTVAIDTADARRGGGAGYRGGGHRGGAVAYRGGAYRGGAVADRGGARYGAYRGYGYRGYGVGAAAVGAAAAGAAYYGYNRSCYDVYGNYICGSSGYYRY